MKDIVQIRDKLYEYKVMMPMPENGKIIAVSSVMTLSSILLFFSFRFVPWLTFFRLADK